MGLVEGEGERVGVGVWAVEAVVEVAMDADFCEWEGAGVVGGEMLDWS